MTHLWRGVFVLPNLCSFLPLFPHCRPAANRQSASIKRGEKSEILGGGTQAEVWIFLLLSKVKCCFLSPLTVMAVSLFWFDILVWVGVLQQPCFLQSAMVWTCSPFPQVDVLADPVLSIPFALFGWGLLLFLVLVYGLTYSFCVFCFLYLSIKSSLHRLELFCGILF